MLIWKTHQVVLLRGHKNFHKYCAPRVVSLAPIHHGKSAYRLTEEYKLILTDYFIENSGKTDEELYEIIKEKIKQWREYYDKEVTEKYSDEDFAWMLLLVGRRVCNIAIHRLGCSWEGQRFQN